MPPHTRHPVPVNTDVWTLALERTDSLYRRFDHVCVSFSGGKDSTAVLNVALQVAEAHDRLPLRVVFCDEEAIPAPTVEYVERISVDPRVCLEWYCLPVKHRNACSRRHPWWWPWAPEDEARWVRPMPANARTAERIGFPTHQPDRLTWPETTPLIHKPQLGNAVVLMGIRAQESITRRRAVLWTTQDNYIKPDREAPAGNVWKAYPIYDWTTEDVWTAPARNGWDYNRTYDALEMAGVPAAMQRCSPPYGEEPLGKLWTYAHCFPDDWARMCERVPGAATAGRHALTELYGYRGVPPKPDGISWPDWITQQLERHDAEGQAAAAASVRRWIINHYGHTADPILPDAPHPLTGVSWRRLLMIAIRGDFKDRKQLGAYDPKDEDSRARFWARYNRERAELHAAGKDPDE